MEEVRDAEVVLKYPLKGISHHVEEERGRTQAKGEAFIHVEVIDEALRKELASNRMAGPYLPPPPYPTLRCSGLGAIPKKDGSWRLINHLSAPSGDSINDYIDPLDFSLQYSTIDDAIAMCHKLGKGALMAKVDLKNAFRLCPVRPADWHLLGIHWRERY